MPDPGDLFIAARALLAAAASEPRPDGLMRRAVSTAYYAVFHMVLQAGAARFVGAGRFGTVGYAAIYRSFSHGRMKSVCVSVAARTLSQGFQRQSGLTTVSQDVRDFASSFLVLQEARISADYDPQAVFSPSDLRALLATAENAQAAFARIPEDEQADILALMLVNPRP